MKKARISNFGTDVVFTDQNNEIHIPESQFAHLVYWFNKKGEATIQAPCPDGTMYEWALSQAMIASGYASLTVRRVEWDSIHPTRVSTREIEHIAETIFSINEFNLFAGLSSIADQPIGIELTYTNSYGEWERFGWAKLSFEQFEYFESRQMITPSWVNYWGETVYQWNLDNNPDYRGWLGK